MAIFGSDKVQPYRFREYSAAEPQDADGWFTNGDALCRIMDGIRLMVTLNRRDELKRIFKKELWHLIPADDKEYQQKYLVANSCFDKGLTLNPSNDLAVLIWIGKGYVWMRLSRTEDALASFEHAVALDQREKYALQYKGICLAKLGRIQESTECYNKVGAIPDEEVIAKKRTDAYTYKELREGFEKGSLDKMEL
jgi:tetratricopeptide (TPR) repeat protein